MNEEPWSVGGLQGTLVRPTKAAARGPLVLIIAGSGPTDRNGNGPQIQTDTYRKLAEGLAAAGIASLRYDKRGIAASRSLVTREEDLSFEDFEADVVTIARALMQRADVSSVVLAGHSEGAILALAAAPKLEPSGIILLCSPGRNLLAVLSAQLQGRLPPDLDASAKAILEALKKNQRVADVPTPLMPLFRPSVQPFLISAGNFDPARLIADVKVPLLVLHAERDLQVMRADLDALRAARPDAEIVILPKANHTLKSAPDDPAGNLALYHDASAPLDPGVIPAIVDFVGRVAR